MERKLQIGIILAALPLVGCRDVGPTAADPERPLFDATASGCRQTTDLIVTGEAGLRTAVAGAKPGNVIAIRGLIAVTGRIEVRTKAITLTCATPGSGLVAQPGGGVDYLLVVAARDVVIDGLELDAREATDGALLAVNNGTTDLAEQVRLTHNSVRCGPQLCAFFVATKRVVIERNYFEADAVVFSGVHLQQSTDGSRIMANTFVALTPSGTPGFGAIRARDGREVVVTKNTVQGPWSNGLALANLQQSTIAENDVTGANLAGIRAVGAPGLQPPGILRDNAFRMNRVTGAGIAGIQFHLGACRNRVADDNDLRGNAGNVGVLLGEGTGANEVRVGFDFLVVDNGAFDCNGDGVNDPNVLRFADGS